MSKRRRARLLVIGACACLGLADCDSKHITIGVPVTCVDTTNYVLPVHYSPTLSPGGDLIAFIDALDGAVYLVDTLGGQAQILVPGVMPPSLGPSELAWAPVGDRIAMLYQGNIWTVEVTTGNLHQWTAIAGLFPRWPGWSPDGRYISYSIFGKLAGAADSTWGLHVIDTVDGSDRAILHGGGSVVSSSRAAWSRNGMLAVSISMMGTVNGQAHIVSELFAVASDGSVFQQLTSYNGRVSGPDLLADGKEVVFDFLPPPCVDVESGRETWAIGVDGNRGRRWGVNLSDPTVRRSYPFDLVWPSGKCASVGRDPTGTKGVLIIQNVDGSGRRIVSTSHAGIPQEVSSSSIRPRPEECVAFRSPSRSVLSWKSGSGD